MNHKIEIISSKSNAKFKYYTDLLSSKGIKENGEFLVFGEKAIQDTLKHYPSKAQALLLAKDTDVNTVLQNHKIQLVCHFFDKTIFQELDIFGIRYPILVCELPTIESIEQTTELFKSNSSASILCPLGDPSNVGALCRSALAFGIQNIILLKESAFPFHPKAVRATSAHLLGLKFYAGPSIQGLAQYEIKNLVALDKSEQGLHTYEWPKSPQILVGEEGQGVPKGLLCKRLQIPMQSNAESLNASIATSIALYSYYTSAKK